MNLSEALDAALPEIPRAGFARNICPRLDPDLIVREDVLDGETVFGVLQRGRANYFRFQPAQWKLAQLFDGARSFDEISALYTSETGTFVAPEDVRFFAENMEENDFWYRTPQEKNLALSEKLMAQRGRRAQRKSKINLAHITFSAWDPDRYLTWLDHCTGRFIYSRWSVIAAVLLFLFEAAVFIAKWKLIGPDIRLYYTFTHKTVLDIVEFWTLLLALGFIHESAHGLTCKHYGGEVHSMGLMFLYLTPAFYVDVTETWISATKVQRLATIIAGIWIEMVVCGLAMVVWTNTQPGPWVHDFTYKIILITGVAVIVMNLNPLIKLDGYYFFTEFIGIPDLKERSTAFVSGWFQSRLLRLPIEIPVVHKKRIPLFVLYALLSGAYSYLLLLVVVRLSYNIASHWLAEFALLPAGALAFVLFRSRLNSLRNLAARTWNHNLTGVGWRPLHIAVITAILALFFLPLWRDREDGVFLVEPSHSATLHAALPGRVSAIYIKEGDHVAAGQPLLAMSSPAAASMRSASGSQTSSSRFQIFSAELGGSSIGVAAARQNAALHSERLADEAQQSLILSAPVNGIVLTENPGTLLNQDVASGQSLLRVAESGPPILRVFIPVSALDRVPAHAEVAIIPSGRFSVVRMTLGSLEGEAVNLPPGLAPRQEYKGIELPAFYSTRMELPASANLPFGTAGTAKIFGTRRSLAGRLVAIIFNLVRAHVW
ncbi:MAG TPA: biotin/lipoyl-binding protein [Edaphobacter sp.]|jgi:putative peptide zinc metalloprotease protein|nr:biotin/lipoyl-binding protein [Edaphobacter sp.]